MLDRVYCNTKLLQTQVTSMYRLRSWHLTQLCLCCISAVAGPAPDLANFTRAGCDNFTGDTWQPLRPAFHITVPYGWMNDPHGMFQLKDTVHLFFQYNPRDLAWGKARTTSCAGSTGLQQCTGCAGATALCGRCLVGSTSVAADKLGRCTPAAPRVECTAPWSGHLQCRQL